MQLYRCDLSMIRYLKTLTDGQQNPSQVLEKIIILLFGSVLESTVLTFL